MQPHPNEVPNRGIQFMTRPRIDKSRAQPARVSTDSYLSIGIVPPTTAMSCEPAAPATGRPSLHDPFRNSRFKSSSAAMGGKLPSVEGQLWLAYLTFAASAGQILGCVQLFGAICARQDRGLRCA